jgi:sigma-B regulation protein RsbU (phosphoserine phosphatase)
LPTKRPILRYVILLLLLAITATYEIPYLYDLVRNTNRNVPTFGTDRGTNRVSLVDKEAKKAGLQQGDRIVAVNGQPFRGLADYYVAVAHAPAGSQIRVDITSGDESHPTERSLLMPVANQHPTATDVVALVALYFLLPVICLALGFWVAFSRPRDPLAWLLLGMMLALPHIFENTLVPGWPPGWREVALLYHGLCNAIFAAVMFLFGMLFPEPFPKRSFHRKLWLAMAWILALPFTMFTLTLAWSSVRGISDYRAVTGVEGFLKPLGHVMQVVAYLLIGTFFAAMGIKYGTSQSPDARRRLKILYWGATIAWTPALVMVIYGLVRGKSVAEVLPQWLIVGVLALLLFFPLTLAYVIVVEKAMDVRVAVRQGLQYALARGGTRVLQTAAVVVVVATIVNVVSNASRNLPQKIGVIALAVIAIVTIRRAGERLRAWIDRRFFREAYDTEQVLTELSDQVRSMVEPKSLLETVVSRLSQTLHVPRIAVLLGGDMYRPAYATGFDDLSDMAFPPNAGTVHMLQRQKEPARVYLQNEDSWLYREEDVSDGERAKLARLGSELLLPLSVRDKLLGFISLGPKRSEEPYSGSDVRLLKSVAAQTGLALENADLMRKISDEVAQRERLNREVEIAREVQERLFPQKLPAIEGLDYAGFCRPALGVGGDYYDFLALPRGHLGVAIGDVSGKGIAAALMMASLQASLRGEATRAPENLAAAVGNVNRLVYEASAENRYATFFYGQYDPARRHFDYVNAGHNPPMVLRSVNGTWEVTRLETGGTVVGLLETFPYEQGRVCLRPGDVVIAFTDGISEAMNPMDEEWGEERLMAAVERCNITRAQDILEHIFRQADSFVAGAKQHDDMTLVVLRIEPVTS